MLRRLMLGFVIVAGLAAQAILPPAPQLTITSTAITFVGPAGLTKPMVQQVGIFNSTNSTPLQWTASATQPWVTLSSTAGTGNSPLGIGVDFSTLTVGNFSDTVTITATGALNSPQTVSITANVVPKLVTTSVNLTLNIPTEVIAAINTWRLGQTNPDGSLIYPDNPTLIKILLQREFAVILQTSPSTTIAAQRATSRSAELALQGLIAQSVQ